MTDYRKDSNFNKDKAFSRIRFGADAPLLETELNELQLIQIEKRRKLIEDLFGEGILGLGTTSYDGNYFDINDEKAVIGGEIIDITSLTIPVGEGDSIYLKTFDKVVDSDDLLKLKGNEQEESLITNDMIDDRFGVETSKRIVVAYNLEKVTSDSSANYLKLGRIEDGKFVSEASKIENVEELSKKIGEVGLTPQLENTAPIFTLGEGKDETGRVRDYSASITNGQISGIRILGNTQLISLIPNRINLWEQGSMDSTGNLTDSGRRIRTISMFNVDIINYKYIEINEEFQVGIAEYDENNVFLQLQAWLYNGHEINYNGSTKKIKIIVSKKNDEPIYSNEILNTNFKLHDNIPKSTVSGTLKSVGKNKFDKSKVIYGEQLDSGGGINITTDSNRSDYIRVIGGNKISFSGRTQSTVEFYDKDKSFISSQLSMQENISVPTNAYYLRFNMSSTDDIDQIQLEYGNVATPYEPHRTSQLSYKLPEGMKLRSIKDSQGNIVANDEVNVTQGIARQRISNEYILDGTRNWGTWNANGTSVNTIGFIAPAPSNIKTGITVQDIIMVCDKLPGNSYSKVYGNDEEGIASVTGDGRLVVRVLRNKLATEDVVGFKQWLSENLPTLTYQLAEPVIYEDGDGSGFEIDGMLESYGEGTTIEFIPSTEDSTTPTIITKVNTNLSGQIFSINKFISQLLNHSERNESDIEEISERLEEEKYEVLETENGWIDVPNTIGEGINSLKAQLKDIKIEGQTIEVLLGEELEDTDSDGVSDGWSCEGVNKSVNNGVQTFTASVKFGSLKKTYDKEVVNEGDIIYGRFTYSTDNVNVKMYLNDGVNQTEGRHTGNGNFETISTLHTINPRHTRFYIAIQDNRADSFTEIKAKKPFVVNLTKVFGKGNEPSKEWCDDNLSFLPTGTHSTVSGSLVSRSRNLFDGELELGGLNNSGNPFEANKWVRSKNFTKIEPNTQYIFGGFSTYTGLTRHFYDINKNFISLAYNTTSFVTPPNAIYMKFNKENETNINTQVMLNKGDIILPYEPHQTSQLSYKLPEGMKLQSVGSGESIVNDEVRVSEGKLYKRVSDDRQLWQMNWERYANADTENYWSVMAVTGNFFNNVKYNGVDSYRIDNYNGIKASSISSVYVPTDGLVVYMVSDGRVFIKIPKSEIEGTIDNSKAKSWFEEKRVSLNYQLNSPIEYEIETHGLLRTFGEGTTIHYEGGAVSPSKMSMKVPNNLYGEISSIQDSVYSVSNQVKTQGEALKERIDTVVDTEIASVNTEIESVKTDLGNLTPADIGAVDKTGDIMSGDLVFDNTKGIRTLMADGSKSRLVAMSESDDIWVGDTKNSLHLYSKSTPGYWNGSVFNFMWHEGNFDPSTKADVADVGVANGIATLDSEGLIPLANMPISTPIKVVNTIAERDAIEEKFEGMRVHVIDASSDSTVTSGWAEYLYDGTAFTKTGEKDSIDVILDWNNVQNKPSTYTPSAHNHDDLYVSKIGEGNISGDIHFNYGKGIESNSSLGERVVLSKTFSDNKIQFGDVKSLTYLFSNNTPKFFNGTNSWEMWHEGNFDPSTKLDKSGGTMSGSLVFENTKGIVSTRSTGEIDSLLYLSGGDTVSLGVNDLDLLLRGKTAKVYDGQSYFDLFHTGNFDPNDYLAKSGGNLEGELKIKNARLLKIFNEDNTKRITINNQSSSGFIYHVEEGTGTIQPMVIGGTSTTNSLFLDIVSNEINWKGNSIFHEGNFNPNDYLTKIINDTPIQTVVTTTTSQWAFRSSSNGLANYSGIWFSNDIAQLLLRDNNGDLLTQIVADGSIAKVGGHDLFHEGNFDPSSKSDTGHGHTQFNGEGIVLGGTLDDTTAVGSVYYNVSQTDRELRANIEGTWQGLWHEGNFNPDTKFNTSGGTLTGQIDIINSGTIAKFISDVSSYVAWHKTNGDRRAYIGFGSDIANSHFTIRNEEGTQMNFYGSHVYNFDNSIIIPGNKYVSDNSYGIDMQNSDIIGANVIQFGDVSDGDSEGIQFMKSDGTFVTLRGNSGGSLVWDSRYVHTDANSHRIHVGSSAPSDNSMIWIVV